MSGWLDELEQAIAAHFCRESCRAKGDPCDLCLGQRRKIRSDAMLANAKPTMQYKPFVALARSVEAGCDDTSRKDT